MIKILDCTLRDGGYVNNFCFGEANIRNIIRKLSKANIDIVECGFLKSKEFDSNKSLFGDIASVKNAICKKSPNTMYVAMIQYGKISIEEINNRDKDSIDGIRLTFHEHEIEGAFVFGEQLKEKGYQVFMQPVGTTTYSDEALLCLIKRVNELMPFAFYMVDTLGVMHKNDVLRMFYLVDNNLNKNIAIGFHPHNNLQLSFANAQELMEVNTYRDIIIDSSVYGMGRGAGNLNTELMTQYINKHIERKYDNLEILEIIDEYIKPLTITYHWGYDAVYYLAAITNSHPNYASFLLNKQTLHVQDIYSILCCMDEVKRTLYDKEYIQQQYVKYMSHAINDNTSREELARDIGEKKVLLLAPGKSVQDYYADLKKLVEVEKPYVISVNHIPDGINPDLLFMSNIKRFDKVKAEDGHAFAGRKTVIASNINALISEPVYVINYASYLCEDQTIVDNAGLMCINLLKKIGVKEISLAGFDGFGDFNLDGSCADFETIQSNHYQEVNLAISKELKRLKTQTNIVFVTPSIYEKLM